MSYSVTDSIISIINYFERIGLVLLALRIRVKCFFSIPRYLEVLDTNSLAATSIPGRRFLYKQEDESTQRVLLDCQLYADFRPMWEPVIRGQMGWFPSYLGNVQSKSSALFYWCLLAVKKLIRQDCQRIFEKTGSLYAFLVQSFNLLINASEQRHKHAHLSQRYFAGQLLRLYQGADSFESSGWWSVAFQECDATFGNQSIDFQAWQEKSSIVSIQFKATFFIG